MCFFRKKKPIEVIDSKYQLGDFVLFKNKRDEATNGNVYAIRKLDNNEIVYDIQVGGECPAIITDIPENKIIKKR